MIIKLITKVISLILSTALLVIPILAQNAVNKRIDKSEQAERIAQLEDDYASGKIAPVDMASFFDGDLNAEIENGIKFNELSYIATHNSYQKDETEAAKQVFRNLEQLTFGLVTEERALFESETLTQQFNKGILSVEIDVEPVVKKGVTSFVCMHMPVWSAGTTCYDFALAMKEIYLWSENNPNHLPITVIIEPKKYAFPANGMKKFSLQYANELDKIIRDTLKDKLCTPADMLRDYESFRDMRLNDDWCKVSDLLGKVMILLHPCDTTTDYIAQDYSVKSQAMFPALTYGNKNDSFASFLLINDPQTAFDTSEEIIDNLKFVVRTRADKYMDVTEEGRKNADLSGAQIVSTDYPQRDRNTPADDVFSFANDKNIKKNK